MLFLINFSVSSFDQNHNKLCISKKTLSLRILKYQATTSNPKSNPGRIYKSSVSSHKLQRVQNAAARLVTNTPRICHITPILEDLHWLPIKYRIQFKIVLLTFKCLYGLAPQYLVDLIAVAPQSRYNSDLQIGVRGRLRV